MIRTYNIGTECYAILIATSDIDFLLPIKVTILDKYIFDNKTTYKVKIKDILEKDFEKLKEHLSNFRVSVSIKTDRPISIIRKTKLDTVSSIDELLTYLNDKPFLIEDNYLTIDKDGLKDLYNKFTKYLINYHFKKLYMLMSRNFIINTPIFENQKDIFKRRVEKIGFGDIFDKYELKLNI